jgi:hypothetical protein
VFNPTETKKNDPARMPASTPARGSALPFTAASAVLPATSQKLRRCLRQRQQAILIAGGCACRASSQRRCPAWPCRCGNSSWMGPTLAKPSEGLLRELGLTSNRVLGTDADRR